MKLEFKIIIYEVVLCFVYHPCVLYDVRTELRARAELKGWKRLCLRGTVICEFLGSVLATPLFF